MIVQTQVPSGSVTSSAASVSACSSAEEAQLEELEEEEDVLEAGASAARSPPRPLRAPPSAPLRAPRLPILRLAADRIGPITASLQTQANADKPRQIKQTQIQ